MRTSDAMIVAACFVVACAPDPPTGETATAGSSSGPEVTDGSTLGAEATTAGEASAGTSTAPGTTGTASGGTSGEATTDGASGEETNIGTESGGSSESGESGESGESESGSSTGPGPDGLVLDPATLEFFWLPIDSLRAAVGGFDAATNTCVTVMFMLGDTSVEHCEFLPDGLFPYVLITPDSAPPCTQWDYVPNVEIQTVAGCMQVTSQDPLDITLDMTLEVSGGPFSGKITVKSP